MVIWKVIFCTSNCTVRIHLHQRMNVLNHIAEISQGLGLSLSQIPLLPWSHHYVVSELYRVQCLSSMKGFLFLLSLYGAVRKKFAFNCGCRPSKIPLA